MSSVFFYDSEINIGFANIAISPIIFVDRGQLYVYREWEKYNSRSHRGYCGL